MTDISASCLLQVTTLNSELKVAESTGLFPLNAVTLVVADAATDPVAVVLELMAVTTNRAAVGALRPRGRPGVAALAGVAPDATNDVCLHLSGLEAMPEAERPGTLVVKLAARWPPTQADVAGLQAALTSLALAAR